MSIKLSEEVAEELKSTGMTANNYKRNPVTGSGFIINRPQRDELIRVWRTKDADVQVHTDKDHTQAVLNVKEKKRTLERNGKNIRVWINRNAETDDIIKNIRNRAASRNPLFGIGRRSTVLTTPRADLIKTIEKAKKDRMSHLTVDTKFKLISPAQDFAVLTGIDEVAHFICMLPKTAESVEHAHEILRPTTVAKGTIRQGEFFFKPASKKIIEKINATIGRVMQKNRGRTRWGGSTTTAGLPRARFLERSSSHYATSAVTVGKVLYVTGTVMDTRTDRHDNLTLEGWHEVVRNTEVPAPRSMSNRTQYWD